jgi:hypothetical protein
MDAPLSLVCPEEKLRIPPEKLEDPGDGLGEKAITQDGVEFRISFIDEKGKLPKEQALPAKAFSLYRAGVYDMAAVKDLVWAEYRPFALKLFGVREAPDTRYGFPLDGTIGTDAAIVWNYPNNRKATIDYEYVDDLHRALRGKARIKAGNPASCNRCCRWRVL